jgi:hypothetical protein
MPTHRVSQGECALSIADQYGFFWKTVWDRPENEQLRRLRGDPNVLQEGDEIFIPEKEIKEVSCATEQKHRFRRKGVPGKLRLRVLVDDEAQANTDYVLIIDGRSRNGKTDSDGFLEESIPAGAVEGELRIKTKGVERRFYLALGALNPIDTDIGVRQRLQQLGYNVDADFEGAVKRFQTLHDLEVSGRVDDAFRQKLKEVFGQ